MVIAILRNRSIRQNRDVVLNKGERLRPLVITMLDPLVSVVLIGGVLWDLMMRSNGHIVAALVGAGIGVPIGMARARVMYVRAVKESRSVIFRRSAMEYGLLGLLLVLRIAESSIAHLHNEFVTYVLTAGIALAVVESIARASAIVIKYRNDVGLPAT
ncbi:MAG TPA: hypothetical protein VMF89_11460 [Polyangiales bacterium]|nr:hypothetical protein [Polyangiales bacterium]